MKTEEVLAVLTKHFKLDSVNPKHLNVKAHPDAQDAVVITPTTRYDTDSFSINRPQRTMLDVYFNFIYITTSTTVANMLYRRHGHMEWGHLKLHGHNYHIMRK